MQFIKNNRLSLEHFLLFVLLPISLALNISIYIKLSTGLIAVAYVVYISIRNSYFKSQKNKLSQSEKKLFYSQLGIKLLVIIILTLIITVVFYKEELFNAIQDNTLKFVLIIAVYVFLSVIPQEFIYRKFYFLRYESIFKNNTQLIAINTIVFCLGHLFFNNLFVLAMTLIGGLVFSMTYNKFKSFKLVCLEHSIYGLWLYFVGLGDLLGFPV